jgi:hypothetical protein
MCLIIHGPSALIRSTLLDTPLLLEEIFKQNGDGLGIMYQSSRGPRVHKWLPRDAAHARRLVQSFPQDNRELAAHWRWRTHGDINKENCHPYAVEGSGFMMHNGVLSTGNSADESKSDTWHYCRNFLDGGVMEKMAHEEHFLKLITNHIGHGNKFVMMTSDGRMSIAGRHRGIEVKGLWFSNTHAWYPETLDPTWIEPDRKPILGGSGGYGLRDYTFDKAANRPAWAQVARTPQIVNDRRH